MTQQGDDCYFYFYSHCTKGSYCPFRHQPLALGREIMCELWQRGACTLPSCPNRHMIIDRERSTIPCYWLAQPGGCKKVHCPFLHSTPTNVNKILNAKVVTNDIQLNEPSQITKEMNNQVNVSPKVKQLLNLYEKGKLTKVNRSLDLSDLEPTSSTEGSKSTEQTRDISKDRSSNILGLIHSKHISHSNSESLKHSSSRENSPHSFHSNSRFGSLENSKYRLQTLEYRVEKSHILRKQYASRSRSPNVRTKKLMQDANIRNMKAKQSNNVKDRLGMRKSASVKRTDRSHNSVKLMDMEIQVPGSNQKSDGIIKLKDVRSRLGGINKRSENCQDLGEGINSRKVTSDSQSLQGMKNVSPEKILRAIKEKLEERDVKKMKSIKVFSLEEIQREKAIQSMLKRQKEMTSRKSSNQVHKKKASEKMTKKSCKNIIENDEDDEINFNHDEYMAKLSLPNLEVSPRKVVIADSLPPENISHDLIINMHTSSPGSSLSKSTSPKKVLHKNRNFESPNNSPVVFTSKRDIITKDCITNRTSKTTELSPTKIIISESESKDRNLDLFSDDVGHMIMLGSKNKIGKKMVLKSEDLNSDISNDQFDLRSKHESPNKYIRESDFPCDLSDGISDSGNLSEDNLDSLDALNNKIQGFREFDSNKKNKSLNKYVRSSVTRIVQVDNKISETKGCGQILDRSAKSRLGIRVRIGEEVERRVESRDTKIGEEISNDQKDSRVKDSSLIRPSHFHSKLNQSEEKKTGDLKIKNQVDKNGSAQPIKVKRERREVEIYRPPGAVRLTTDTEKKEKYNKINARLGFQNNRENVKTSEIRKRTLEKMYTKMSLQKIEKSSQPTDWGSVKSFPEILREKELKKLQSSKESNTSYHTSAESSNNSNTNKATYPGEYIGSLNASVAPKNYPLLRNNVQILSNRSHLSLQNKMDTSESRLSSESAITHNSRNSLLVRSSLNDKIVSQTDKKIEDKNGLDNSLVETADWSKIVIKPALFIPKKKKVPTATLR